MPEPDLVVTPRRNSRLRYANPEPADVALVVEVADSSLDQDRSVMSRTYGGGGVPVYWIVNLVDLQVEVYPSDPSGSSEPVGYRHCDVYRVGQEIPLCHRRGRRRGKSRLPICCPEHSLGLFAASDQLIRDSNLTSTTFSTLDTSAAAIFKKTWIKSSLGLLYSKGRQPIAQSRDQSHSAIFGGTSRLFLQTLFEDGVPAGLTDGQLLKRFATGRGEAAELAFAVLVERHGPMVFRPHGILRDDHEAMDAFQATFLVLVRKGPSLWVRDSWVPGCIASHAEQRDEREPMRVAVGD